MHPAPASTTISIPAQLANVVEVAEATLAKRLSTNTRAAYSTDWAQFTGWCAGHGFEVLPADPAAVILWLTELRMAGRSVASIRRKASAIAHAHRSAGLVSPTTNQVVVDWLDGLRKESARAGEAQHRATALTRDRLVAAVSRIGTERAKDLRDRALLLVGFAGLFRRSELVGLLCTDVEFVDEGVQIRLRSSKTNTSGRAELVAIKWGADPELCPVRALIAWNDVACGCGFESDTPLFRAVGKGDRISDRALTAQSVNLIVKDRTGTAGLGDGFSGHSLRRGGATTMARAGASSRQLERSGRWTPGSGEVAKYIEDANLFDDTGARFLGL